MNAGQHNVYMVDGIHVPPEFFASRIGTDRPGFSFLLLEHNAYLSTREVGRWYRRTTTPDGPTTPGADGIPGTSDDEINIGSRDEFLLRIEYDRSWTFGGLLSWFQTRRTATLGGYRYVVVEDSYNEDLTRSLNARLSSARCMRALDALLKELKSKFKTFGDLVRDVEQSGGFLQTIDDLKDPGVDGFADIVDGKRMVVANAAFRKYDSQNLLPNVYGSQTTTRIHELLHIANGKRNHTRLAKAMLATSKVLSDNPISAARKDGTDFSNPSRNTDGDNRDYMNRWIQNYCPAASPPPSPLPAQPGAK